MNLRRHLSFATALIITALPSVTLAKERANVAIVRVFTGWRDAASFKRISEYFKMEENPGGETIVRTKPDQRGGFYFFARTVNPGPAQPVKITVQLIMPADPKPKPYTFATQLKAGTTLFDLGVTGTDWPDAKTNPVAWKLDLVAADGTTLATEESYLWEKPAVE